MNLGYVILCLQLKLIAKPRMSIGITAIHFELLYGALELTCTALLYMAQRF